MNYLGIDFGIEHVGLSLASGPLAEPLTTIPREKLLSQLPQLLAKHQINAIVIGVPDGPIAAEVESFINDLAVLNIPIHRQDETLSSQDAIHSLLHVSQTKRRLHQHAAAATLILQSWLDNPHSLA